MVLLLLLLLLWRLHLTLDGDGRLRLTNRRLQLGQALVLGTDGIHHLIVDDWSDLYLIVNGATFHRLALVRRRTVDL